ncbi:hypothetical protein [Vulgatibacter sp.]|uniref:hypothetical protein n=1 Tax=Vulgatibacter sp. TaxID=1971226 RepID=UPI003568413F
MSPFGWLAQRLASPAAPRSLREWAGLAGGVALAPFTGATAWMRQARTFHPEGAIFRAAVNPLVSQGPDGVLAAHLAGEALVRLSSAVWRGGREWIDILGCAVRFRSERIPSVIPAANDQDLLCATIRSPWTMPFAPVSTHWHDFLRNDYYAVSPFSVEGLGRVKFRITTARTALPGRDRSERLQVAVESGLASLRLEFRPVGGRVWKPLCAVRLLERLDLDQEALRFDPFRAGRGIRPVGFVQYLRPASYRASQRLRPRSTAEQTGGVVRKPRWAPIPVRDAPRGHPHPWEATPPHRHGPPAADWPGG